MPNYIKLEDVSDTDGIIPGKIIVSANKNDHYFKQVDDGMKEDGIHEMVLIAEIKKASYKETIKFTIKIKPKIINPDP